MGSPGPVTVAVTNFDGAAFLEECLDAVAALRGDIAEVLVVDNASTDDSVERIVGHELVRSGRARLLELSANDGPCPARNRALSAAGTPWVLQIDSDVILPPDTLERLRPQTAEPGVVAVQPRAVLAHDPDTVHYDAGAMHYVGVMCLSNLLSASGGAAGAPRDVDAVISMALLLDRRAVLDAGGYDPAFFILFEDHDLSYRLRARGLRLRLVPEAVVWHREGTRGLSYRPGAPSYPARRAFLHARNRAYLVLKNYSWPALLLSLPGRVVFGLTWWVFALRRGVGWSYLKGRLDLLRLVPRALSLRKDLGGRRRVGDRTLLGAADLTFSPVIARRGIEDRLEHALSRVLRFWWRCIRWMVPA